MQQRLLLDVLKHELQLAAFSDCDIEAETGTPSRADTDRIDKGTLLILEHLDELRDCALLIDPMFSPERAVASQIHALFRELDEIDGSTANTHRTPLKNYAARAARIIAKACES